MDIPPSTIESGARGRSAREFWHIPKSGWRDILVRTWSQTGEDNLSLLAAGVAFYSFLAFVPLLAAVVLVYGIVANPTNVATHVAELTRLLPADAAKIIANQLKGMTATPVTRTSIGLVVAILLALYGAMRGATSIIEALNITYGERETRSIVRTYGLAFGFTLGAVLVTIVALFTISAMTLIGGLIQLPSVVGPIVTVGLWIATALVASGLIAIIYRFGPDREHARWTWLTPGSLFASFGTLIATLLFGLYVSHFAGYNATYGALGAVVSFLMWLYVAAFVILLGAELNAEIEHQTAKDTTTGAELPQGQRGAVMADTTAGVPLSPDRSDLSVGSYGANIPALSPAVAADPSILRVSLASGFVASQLTRIVGDMKIGTIPLSLMSGGIALLGRRGRAPLGLMCIAAGGLLVFRAQGRANRAAEPPCQRAPR
ncbi:YihY/virulence factor BrkB family protein [Sphingomonas sp. CGMCC 1.13654]|uniref:YihY/virulence factor BrkB family protein n=1 Tax=Sphingomonas chungangi TaxID=2683589 RepID=A0A838LCI7_9SPHN|nr:YihY/virulence factor BrkB family protein [Sphingomonas chungangi]